MRDEFILKTKDYGWGREVVTLEIVGDKWRLHVGVEDERGAGSYTGRYIYPGTPGDFA